MEQDVKIKASSLENLHEITVGLIELARKFGEKYSGFTSVISIKHKDLQVVFSMYKIGEDE